MIAFLLISSMSIFAQDEPAGKLNVFFDYFDRTNSTPFIWAETVRNQVMEGIQKTNRVNLIDVDSRGTLAIEKSRREQDNAAAGDDMERLKAMTEEGANLLVKGIVNNISTREVRDSKGELISYESTISFTLKVIDPNNGTTVLTKNFTLPKNSFADLANFNTSGNTEEEAVQNRAKTAVKEMKGFVEEAFPTVGKIIDLDEKKGNEAKSAYINLGSENGIAKGAKFEIRVKRIIGDKTSFKLVGEGEVTDVEGDDISKIKIKKGGKEIFEAFDKDQELVVRSAR